MSKALRKAIILCFRMNNLYFENKADLTALTGRNFSANRLCKT